MENFNAVKFKAIVNKSNLKQILMDTFDLNVQLKYPQLANSKDEIPIRGICLIGDFEQLTNIITPKGLSFIERYSFHQNISFKLIEVEVEPVELPAGAEEEGNVKLVKK